MNYKTKDTTTVQYIQTIQKRHKRQQHSCLLILNYKTIIVGQTVFHTWFCTKSKEN